MLRGSGPAASSCVLCGLRLLPRNSLGALLVIGDQADREDGDAGDDVESAQTRVRILEGQGEWRHHEKCSGIGPLAARSAADAIPQVHHPIALNHDVRVLEHLLSLDRSEIPLA